jgi:DNA invertase Pin-like site-specific DNA recombinase
MIKAYSYLRFSKPEQIKGDSQRRQLEKSRTWAEANGAELVEEMQDHGISAFKGANRMIGVLGRFLDLIRIGEIKAGSYLIVENIDRISREEVLVALRVYMDIIEHGIKIVTLIDEQVHSQESIKQNPMILQMAIASMARANQESELKSERIGDAWAESRRLALEGKPSHMGRLPCWLKRDKKSGEVVLIPAKAKAMAYLFELACNGDLPHTITRKLNQAKMPPLTTRGKANVWNVSSVRKLLQSVSAVGTLIVNEPYQEEVKDKKGITKKVKKYRKIGEVKDYYPKVVSKETFAKVQTQLRGRKDRAMARRGGSKASVRNAFSGLAREMGSNGGVRYTYNLVTTKGKEGGKKGKGAIKPKTRRMEYLRAHRSVKAGLGYESFSWNYKDFQDIFCATCRLALQATSKVSEEETALAVVREEIESLKDSIEGLLDLAAMASSSKSDILNKLEAQGKAKGKKEEEAKALEDTIVAAQKTREQLPANIDDRVELRRILQANVRTLEIDFETKLFKCVLYSGISYDAWLSESNELFVKTNDFEVPANAFKNIKIRQGWNMRKRRNPVTKKEAVA